MLGDLRAEGGDRTSDAPPGPSPLPVSSRSELTHDQERDLVIATEGGDPVACRRLVEAFMPRISALTR